MIYFYETIDPCAHHKIFVGKQTCAVLVAFILLNNNVSGARKIILIAHTRVRNMIKANKYSHKRVCKDDGTCTCPKISSGALWSNAKHTSKA